MPYKHFLEKALESFESLWTEETLNNNSWTLLFLAVLLTFRIITFMQRERVKLYYMRGSSLAQSFMS
jgi:hypothetical protein